MDGATLDKQIAAGEDVLAKVKLPTPASKKAADITAAFGLHPEAAMAAWFANLALGASRGFGTMEDFLIGLALYDRLSAPDAPAMRRTSSAA